MKVKLTREQRIHVLNSTDVYKVMQDILLRENKIGRSKEHMLGRMPLADQQDTAHRADQPRNHKENGHRSHRSFQLRTPETGCQGDHGPQPPQRLIGALHG